MCQNGRLLSYSSFLRNDRPDNKITYAFLSANSASLKKYDWNWGLPSVYEKTTLGLGMDVSEIF